MDKYCLKWTKFQSNLTRTLSDLRKEEDFFDVTLVSEELRHISAHKLVLSSSSDLFKSILKATQTSNPHPLIYLSGVSAKHLNFAMNYIYQVFILFILSTETVDLDLDWLSSFSGYLPFH